MSLEGDDRRRAEEDLKMCQGRHDWEVEHEKQLRDALEEIELKIKASIETQQDMLKRVKSLNALLDA